jgi:hypothetical protein
MVELKMPPGRKSISQAMVFQGFGQNHGNKSSGSVQQRQISSFGTSTMRVNVRSKFEPMLLSFFNEVILLNIFTHVSRLNYSLNPQFT